MNKIFKKIIGVILSAIMIFSVPMTTYAASQTNNNIEESIMELEKYLSLTEEGTIFFDTNEALKDGFSEEIVMAVEKNIANMNKLALEGLAQIDNSFTATIYFPSTRANGESKIITHWYGTTEIYLNSDEADAFVNTMRVQAGVISDISTFLTILHEVNPNHATAVASVVGSAFWLQAVLNLDYFQKIASSNRGIVIYITNLPADNVCTMSAFSQ